jgi:hypothetical protein
MASEKWSPQPYTEQEFLSFDRLKRAVMNRVLDRSEALMVDEFPISPERTAELIKDEWHRAKEAIRSSPAARQAFRKHLEGVISEQIDGMIKTDKTELGSLGVVEKSI